MPENPVVTCYRGPDSSAAVQLGSRLASVLGQPLALATAYRYEPSYLGSQPLSSSSNEARLEAAQARIERAELLVPTGVEVQEHVIPAEDIAEALAELARDVGACLVIVGRDLDGHTTRDLLHDAPCPVAVSPLSVPLPGEGEGPLGAIAVAYDGSPSARYALSAAMHLAVRGDAHIDLLVAGATDRAAVLKDAEAVAAELSESVESGVHALDGAPGRTLIEASEGYDLLLCGSRGRGRAMARVLGSVSTELVQGCHCPLIVVPPKVRRLPTAPLGLTTAGI